MAEKIMYRPDHGGNGYRLKAFVITMMNNQQSTVSTRKLLHSINITRSNLQTFIMPATIPETIDKDIRDHFSKEYRTYLYDTKGNLRWTWPKSPAEDGIDFSTGLYKRAYAAADWKKVAACMISHMRLWQHCIDINEPIVILEHDAYFVFPFNYKQFVEAGQEGLEGFGQNQSSKTQQWIGGICGLNHPAGTTRKATVFNQKVKAALQEENSKKELGLTTVPYVDDPGDLPLPNGIAGNSAYIIKPWAAQKLLDKVKEVGLWPNDALMCRQFFPWLQVCNPYFTQVQNTPSTTTR